MKKKNSKKAKSNKEIKTKKNEELISNDEIKDDDSFIKKIKNDKKYRAKVELIGYGIFIIGLIVFFNIFNVGNNYDYNMDEKGSNDKKVEDKNDTLNLFDILKEHNDNYSYDIEVLVDTVINEEGEIKKNAIKYNGKAYKNNLIINRVIDSNSISYYKVDDLYYVRENDKYNVVSDRDVYSIIEGKYIEFVKVKELIDKANLEHFSSYSSGKYEYTYKLKISDMLSNYKEDEGISINVVGNKDEVVIEVDYTELFNKIDEDIDKCEIKYTYKDINAVEEFSILVK